jgi:hypothetical protein
MGIEGLSEALTSCDDGPGLFGLFLWRHLRVWIARDLSEPAAHKNSSIFYDWTMAGSSLACVVLLVHDAPWVGGMAVPRKLS